jgi:molybdopterin synthase catalytic subunit
VYRKIQIQLEDFAIDAVLESLKSETSAAGGFCFFAGVVRDMNDDEAIESLYLEHYPEMTEKQLHRILDEAESRFGLLGAVVIHRIGSLLAGDNIVLVAVAAGHRGEAFSACEMIMDYLKTRATFWKKEITSGGDRWVATRGSDLSKEAAWDDSSD